jgi:hypothetical protein
LFKEDSMAKQSLIFGTIALVLTALLALAGCSNPASDGAGGAPGRESLVGTIDAVQLRELFAVNDTVQLLSGATNVTGEVPPGKTLEISGAVEVAAGNLEVNGLLHIKSGGELSQNTGRLQLGRSGRVVLEGFVYLEQDLFLEQPIAAELNGGEVNFDPRVTLGATGGLSLHAGVVPVGVNNYFTKVSNLKWANITPLTTATIPVLTNWTPGKTLILNAAAIIATTDIDVSNKGTLVIDGGPTNLDLDTFTLKASDTVQNVIVEETGSITFSTATSKLAGNIKVKGGLIADYDAGTNPVTAAIPASVDLSEATLSATDTDLKTFLFENIENYTFHIGKVDVTYNLTLRESRGLAISSVTNVGASGGGTTLSIPPDVTTTIDEVAVDGTETLTIDNITATAQSAILKLGYVAGDAGLILGSDPDSKVVLEPIDGRNITVASTSSITLDSNVDLLTLGIDSTAQSTLLGKIKGGVINLDALTPTISQPITINTILTTTGNLTIASDVTFNVSPSLVVIIINSGKNLILGSEVEIARGTALTLTEGVYQAVGTNVTIPANGVINLGANAASAGLKIGASVAGIADDYIALTNNAATAGIFTPTATTGVPVTPVQFGKTGIRLPAGTTTGAIFQVNAVGRLTIAGTDPTIGITLAPGADRAHKGNLYLLNGAILVTTADTTGGYTALDTTLPAGNYSGGAFTPEGNTSLGVYIVTSSTTDDAIITSATKSTT